MGWFAWHISGRILEHLFYNAAMEATSHRPRKDCWSAIEGTSESNRA